MDKSMYLLWSVEQWLHFEELWEVSVVVVKKLGKLGILKPRTSALFPLHCRIIIQWRKFFWPSASEPIEIVELRFVERLAGGRNFCWTIIWQCNRKKVDVLAFKHLYTKTKLKGLDDNIFLKKLTFLFFLFNKKGLLWKVVYCK
jgi:hypothetical protein